MQDALFYRHMHLRFVIDKEYDRQFVKGKKAKELLEEKYRCNARYMRYSQREYQKAWDEIDEAFSAYIERITGYPWFYPSYRCVVSATQVGISNWGEAPVIVRGWKEHPYTQRRITAHELILSHYFEIYRRHFATHVHLKDEQVWALAEIAAFALTSLTDEAKRFWPWDTKGYYTNHNYPQLVELQLKMKKKFIERKSFQGYIESGLRMVTAYPDISPWEGR